MLAHEQQKLNEQLLKAVSNNNDSEVHRLLAAGANPDIRDLNAVSLINLAIQKSNIAIVRMLIEHNADIHAVTDRGCAPVHYAADNGSTDILELLVEAGADINHQNDDNATPLMFAIEMGQEMSVRIMVENLGADVNICGKVNKNSALHRAANENLVDTLRFLIDNGVDLNQTNNAGHKVLAAIALQIDVNNINIFELMLEHSTMEEREAAIDIARNNKANPILAHYIRAKQDRARLQQVVSALVNDIITPAKNVRRRL